LNLATRGKQAPGDPPTKKKKKKKRIIHDILASREKRVLRMNLGKGWRRKEGVGPRLPSGLQFLEKSKM